MTAPCAEPPVLRTADFQKIARLAYQHFGLDLQPGKEALVESRIGKKLRELGLCSFSDYLKLLEADTSGELLTGMVDLLTTNHTSFFREPRHFDFLTETILPALSTRSELHLWSAACSSGEEPYSLAMTLLEQAREHTIPTVRIRATDISTRVLAHAKNAIYTTDRCSSIPAPVQQRYLLRGTGNQAGAFRFKPEVRAMIDFSRLNLMDPLPELSPCSVIFCRNIMIYFDRPTQQSLVQRLTERLEPGGYLFIGHSESLNTITHTLDYISPAIWRKPAIGGGSASGSSVSRSSASGSSVSRRTA